MSDRTPSIYVGVDGGQSSTLALAADESGNILGSGLAGPSNHIHEPGGEDRFRTAMTTSVHGALASAGASLEDVAVIGMGLTGYNERMRVLASGLFRSVPVVSAHDTLSALYGASGGQEGVVVISGTGSVALGHREDGEERRAGGWGHLASDEGSGYWVGLEGLRAAFRSFDGRTAPSLLEKTIPDLFGVPDVPALHRALYVGTEDRALIASLAKEVSDAAEEGDRVAQGILHHAALHLANLVVAVVRPLWGDGSVQCYGQGGMFESRYMGQQLDAWLERLAPNVERDEPLAPPSVGALVIAYKAVGVDPNNLDWRALQSGAVAKSAPAGGDT